MAHVLFFFKFMEYIHSYKKKKPAGRWLFFFVSLLQLRSCFWAILCGGGSMVSVHVAGSGLQAGSCSLWRHQQEAPLLLGLFMLFYPHVEGSHPYWLSSWGHGNRHCYSLGDSPLFVHHFFLEGTEVTGSPAGGPPFSPPERGVSCDSFRFLSGGPVSCL